MQLEFQSCNLSNLMYNTTPLMHHEEFQRTSFQELFQPNSMSFHSQLQFNELN